MFNFNQPIGCFLTKDIISQSYMSSIRYNCILIVLYYNYVHKTHIVDNDGHLYDNSIGSNGISRYNHHKIEYEKTDECLIYDFDRNLY